MIVNRSPAISRQRNTEPMTLNTVVITPEIVSAVTVTVALATLRARGGFFFFFFSRLLTELSRLLVELSRLLIEAMAPSFRPVPRAAAGRAQTLPYTILSDAGHYITFRQGGVAFLQDFKEA